MQVIVYTNEYGNVSVCIPTGELPIEEVLNKDCPVGAYIIEDSRLPQDDDFFDAWELVGDEITVNIDKAKEIHKSRLRLGREALLAAQDVAFMKAIETGADTSTIVAERQRLRDVTGLVDVCTTLEEIRAITCEGAA